MAAEGLSDDMSLYSDSDSKGKTVVSTCQKSLKQGLKEKEDYSDIKTEAG